MEKNHGKSSGNLGGYRGYRSYVWLEGNGEEHENSYPLNPKPYTI